jgi:glycine betaine/choline ABC-type transport system substrate-binding protein
VPAALVVVVIVVIVVLAAVLGGTDEEPAGDAGGGATTVETAPPSAAELELVDIDLADPSAPSTALEAGELTVAVAPATLRTPSGLVALDDDRDAFAAEPIVPVIGLDVALPELDPLLQPVAAALSTDELVTLVAAAGAPGAVREDVVSAWLEGKGLLDVDPIEAPGRMRIQTLADADLGLVALAYGEVMLAAGFEVEQLAPGPTAATLVAAVGDRTADMVLGGGSSLAVALGASPDELPSADELRGEVDERAATISGTALTSIAADRRLRALTSAATAEELGLAVLSDLGMATGRLRVGAPAGCGDDPLCRAVLEDGYGLRFAA